MSVSGDNIRGLIQRHLFVTDDQWKSRKYDIIYSYSGDVRIDILDMMLKGHDRHVEPLLLMQLTDVEVENVLLYLKILTNDFSSSVKISVQRIAVFLDNLLDYPQIEHHVDHTKAPLEVQQQVASLMKVANAITIVACPEGDRIRMKHLSDKEFIGEVISDQDFADKATELIFNRRVADTRFIRESLKGIAAPLSTGVL